jgi:hypothetical protein
VPHLRVMFEYLVIAGSLRSVVFSPPARC